MSKNKLPHILNKEQLSKLFEAVYLPKTAIAMFVSLMLGLRINEIRQLEITDINIKERKVLIRNSKNTNRSKEGYGKDRIIPLPQIAISPIKKWIDIVGEQSRYFLPSDKTTEKPVSKGYLHKGFREAVTRAGLNSVEYKIKYKTNSHREGRKQYHLKWHSLRHFYACYVYEKTRDLYSVSKLLGHNQVTTTQIYAKVSDKVLRESIDFSFPDIKKTKIYEENPISASNFSIPNIAKKEKTPIEVIEERYARGELSDIEYQNKIRLLKIRKQVLNEDETIKLNH